MHQLTELINRMEKQHTDLDKELALLLKNPNFNEAEVTTIKKRKLHLKDEIKHALIIINQQEKEEK